MDELKLRDLEGWDALVERAKEQWAPLIVQQAPLSYLKSIRYLRPLATVPQQFPITLLLYFINSSPLAHERTQRFSGDPL